MSALCTVELLNRQLVFRIRINTSPPGHHRTAFVKEIIALKISVPKLKVGVPMLSRFIVILEYEFASYCIIMQHFYEISRTTSFFSIINISSICFGNDL